MLPLHLCRCPGGAAWGALLTRASVARLRAVAVPATASLAAQGLPGCVKQRAQHAPAALWPRSRGSLSRSRRPDRQPRAERAAAGRSPRSRSTPRLCCGSPPRSLALTSAPCLRLSTPPLRSLPLWCIPLWYLPHWYVSVRTHTSAPCRPDDGAPAGGRRSALRPSPLRAPDACFQSSPGGIGAGRAGRHRSTGSRGSRRRRGGGRVGSGATGPPGSLRPVSGRGRQGHSTGGPVDGKVGRTQCVFSREPVSARLCAARRAGTRAGRRRMARGPPQSPTQIPSRHAGAGGLVVSGVVTRSCYYCWCCCCCCACCARGRCWSTNSPPRST